MVCKANIPQQTDLRVQVKTNERFCSAGSDDTCAGERILDLGGDGGNLDLAAPGLEPLLVLLANAVCTNSVVVGDDKCCDSLVDNGNGACVCSKVSTNNTVGVNSTAKLDNAGIIPANNTDSEIREKNMNTFENEQRNLTNVTSFGAEENPVVPIINKPSFSPPSSLTVNVSSSAILLKDLLKGNNETESSTSTDSKTDSDCRNSTSNVTSQKLQSKEETVQRNKEKRKIKNDQTNHHVQNDSHKNCSCPEPKRKPRPPWPHNDVFKGYCKCRDLGIFRTCRRCKMNG